jgi:transposase, IS5 family
VGEAGLEAILKATIDAAVVMKALEAAEFERVIVDTTCKRKPLPTPPMPDCWRSPVVSS